MGAAIGQTIQQQAPGSSFTYEPGRRRRQLQLVDDGRVQLGIAHAQMALRAMKGDRAVQGEDHQHPRHRPARSAATIQIVVRKDSPFSSLDQIAKEKKPIRIALNKRGTMMAIAGEKVFEAAGIPDQRLAAWGGRVEYVAYNDGLDMLKNGQVDLVLNMLAFPSSHSTVSRNDLPVKLLPIPDSRIAKINTETGTKTRHHPGRRL